jgi:hypothetical protein
LFANKKASKNTRTERRIRGEANQEVSTPVHPENKLEKRRIERNDAEHAAAYRGRASYAKMQIKPNLS